MNRRQTDLGVGLLVVGILIVGGALSWDAYRQQQSVDRMGSMMGGSMDAVHGTDPLVYVLGTLFATAVVGVFYLAVRTDVPPERDAARADSAAAVDEPSVSEVTDDDSALGGEPTAPDAGARANGSGESETVSQRRVLDLLPEDERRVLEPVLTSPGLTQIELRDRSDFSKSKVSQTVSDLEKRGLLYRERQGRTYRVYPSDELEMQDPALDQQQFSSSGDQ
ncbi:helix-turn-helix transcriptional regulator [Halapricum salinum]|uniref:Transcriptional regulator n=1 Tax=Halapricum salinum TaxID=1457250 RepID=A0A4D6HHD6_9EURY|nr:MarR family transcriptional regulator [Halapricum salinum]QCC52432.1 transcriptional regulator [Halapricum salinum]